MSFRTQPTWTGQDVREESGGHITPQGYRPVAIHDAIGALGGYQGHLKDDRAQSQWACEHEHGTAAEAIACAIAASEDSEEMEW